MPLDVGAYFTIGAIALGLLYLWAVSCTAKIARRRIWDTAIMCLAPLLIVHAFTNWDLLAIGLTAGAMLAWARKKPVLAGALFGLGAAAKLYPVLLLGPLLILCLRAGKMREWTRTAIGAAAVWLVINVPVMLAWPAGWYEFIRLNSERPPEYDSWYFIYATLARSSIWDKVPGADSPTLVNLLSLALFALACAGHRLVRPVGATPTPVRAARVPGDRRVPADQQGLVAAVLAVAAAAGGAGATPLAAAAVLAGLRGDRLGAADALLRRRGEQGPVDLPVHQRRAGPGRDWC